MLTPEKIYNDVKESNMSLDDGIKSLKFLIQQSDDAYQVKQSINVAVKLMGPSDDLFKILESCLISDDYSGVRIVAAKELIHNFPSKCIAPLTWTIQHDESNVLIKEIFSLVKIPANRHLGVLREEIEKRFLARYGVLGKEAEFFLDFDISHPHLIKEYIDEGVKPSNAAVLAIFGSLIKIKLINAKGGVENFYFYQRDEEGNVEEIMIGAGENSLYLRIIPKQIYLLKRLRRLYLAFNGIESLPETIGNLNALKSLDLSFNKIKKLPKSIGTLKSLEELVLQKNELQEIPESIGDLDNLKKLFLSENNLKEIPESIGNLKSLEILTLSDNNIEDIPQSIGQLSSLKHLNLCRNNIRKIPKSITNLKALKHLEIEHNEVNKFV